MFTQNSTIGDVRQHPLFRAHVKWIIGPGNNLEDSIPLNSIGSLRSGDALKSVHGGLNALVSQYEKGIAPIPVWSEQAILDTPEKALSMLFPFLTGKGGPFAVICPGGGYERCVTLTEGFPIAAALNHLGINAFVLTYRVGEAARYPAPQEDLAEAVRLVLDRAGELNVAKENYSVWGFSAGGHLAASFGTEKMGYQKYGLPAPLSLVLAYPVITMLEKAHVGSRNALLGPDSTLEMRELTSVERGVNRFYPSTFVWTLRGDGSVPFENSRGLKKALSDAGVHHRLKVFEGIGHGFSLAVGTPAEPWFAQAVAFWRAAMR